MVTMDANNVRYVSVVRSSYEWTVVPRLRSGDKPLASSLFVKKVQAVLSKKFDYAEEAAEAAQQTFCNAKVDVVGRSGRSVFSRTLRREIATALWESGQRDLAVQFAKATLPRRR